MGYFRSDYSIHDKITFQNRLNTNRDLITDRFVSTFQDNVREIPLSEKLPKFKEVVASKDVTFSVDPNGRAVVFAEKKQNSVIFFLVRSIEKN